MLAGLMILNMFGVVWLVLGVTRSPLRSMSRILAAGAILLLSGALLYFSVHAMQHRHVQALSGAAWTRLKWGFTAVNVAQYLAIVAVIVWALNAKRRDILMALISMVIGIHFLFLAPLFHLPLYYCTGVAILLIDLQALRMREDLRNPWAAYGTGIVLWGTVVAMLIIS